MRNAIGILASLLALSGCQKTESTSSEPKDRLSQYIGRTFAVRGAEDRHALASFLTGEARRRLTAWSDEQFLRAFTDTKRAFIRLTVTETKQISPSESRITYELTYLDQGRGHDAKVTNKKVSTFVLENGVWLISEVRNVKELVEYQNEMALP